MHKIQQIDDLRKIIRQYKREAKSIGFVPTMGNLHQGHLSLIQKAKAHCDIVIVSIFVNPLQFAANEDLDTYPRTLENDLRLLQQEHCNVVFFPASDALLNTPNMTSVSVPVLREGLEGAVRKGHLDGVATIVTLFFNLIQPNAAFFGKKDYQQWLMIKKMVADLKLDIDIIGCETQREKDGLALSSRNQYLTPEQRKKAPLFRQALLKCAHLLQTQNIETTLESTRQELSALGFGIDYLVLRKQQTLAETNSIKHSVLISTVRLGKTRLLDNIEL